MTPALTACGNDSGSGKTTLKLVAADYGDNTTNTSQRYWDRVTVAFEAEHPDLRIDVKVYSWTEVDRKVAEMVKAGDAPDLAQIGAYADYAAAGKLYRADQLLSIPTQASFVPSIAQAGKVRRVLYGLPFVASSRLLFYNKKLFAKAGIAEAPTTWEELQAAAEKLKSSGVKIPYGLPLGPEEAPAETMLWMLSGGGGYTDSNGSYVLDSPENIKTFEWLRDELVAKGLTGSRTPGRVNRQDLFDAFTRGEVGMLNGHPTLMKQAEGRGIDYDTAPLPTMDGKPKSTMGVEDWMMAFKQNGHQEEIGRFLNYVYNEENVLDFASRYDLLPVTTAASQAMRDDREFKRLWKFLDQMERAEFYPADKTSWASVSKALKKNIGATVAEGGDPMSVLGELQREADAAESSAR
ncbi:extracellular solute-binding protein [Streptomyces sp. XD-27]|uniref:extracellular solute-binding protein n=1 Tax=Streptomyces sp. XD-27 TaxID=3062779 RepID=UPI0026F45867|nr:extracellular solute-binding protein [Streptomyces sp. XD-27]WKX71055.1 extracellular solute-binding protein [Streptomyces sp. XD-27]